MKPNQNNIREFPRSFGERFKENESSCPSGSEVVLCACGNTFHKPGWSKSRYCSQACIFRYGKQVIQVFKEAFAPAS